MQLRTYRVHTPIPGVYASETCKGFVSIPSGAILVAKHDRNPDKLYVRVQWNNRELLVFLAILRTAPSSARLHPKARLN